MQYTLFGNFRSPYSYMVYAGMTYKQLQFIYKNIDLNQKEQKAPEYLAMNPMGQIPLLVVEDKQPIFESTAIIEYLEDSNPNLSLFPKDSYAKSIIRTLWCLLSGSIIKDARNLFLASLGRITLTIEQRIENQNVVQAKCQVLENLLSKHHQLLITDNPFMYLFYQAWYNLSLGFPEIRTICSRLEKYHQEISHNNTIKMLENITEVKQLRNKMYSNHNKESI